MQHVWLDVGGVDCPYVSALCGCDRSRVAACLRPPGGQDVFNLTPTNGVTLNNKSIRPGCGWHEPDSVRVAGRGIARALNPDGVVCWANKQTSQQYAHARIFRLDSWQMKCNLSVFISLNTVMVQSEGRPLSEQRGRHQQQKGDELHGVK